MLVFCFLLAMIAGWTDLGAQIDNDAYDFVVRAATPEPGAISSRTNSNSDASISSPLAETLSLMGKPYVLFAAGG